MPLYWSKNPPMYELNPQPVQDFALVDPDDEAVRRTFPELVPQQNIRKRKRKLSVAVMIRQARKSGERGPVRVELVNADGSRAVVTSSQEPAADLLSDDAEKLWHERIAKHATH
jgi:hypothetical protein